MSLLIIAMEYMLLHTIFETIRSNDEKYLNQKALDEKRKDEMLSGWNPLSTYEWNSIRKLNK